MEWLKETYVFFSHFIVMGICMDRERHYSFQRDTGRERYRQIWFRHEFQRNPCLKKRDETSDLFDRANRRNHTELFVIVQIPDHFTFIIDFEYLGAVGLYGILVMSLPVADVQAAILCRKQAGDEEQAGSFDIVLTVTAGYFAVEIGRASGRERV